MFKKLFLRAYFRGSLFSEGHIIGRNFAFQNGLGLTIKTANCNLPWAYIRDGLLSEGYLRLRFWGAYFWEGLFWEGGGLLSEFYGRVYRIIMTQITLPTIIERGRIAFIVPRGGGLRYEMDGDARRLA